MILHDMTWQELAKIDWENTVVLIPLGATEQHGPHLPVDTDTRLVTGLAEEVERSNTAHILLTPSMWLGHSPHHLAFGGTLSAYHQAYIPMIRSICESYIHMGAQKLWLLNGHGGNRVPLAIVLQELKNEHKELIVVSAEYWNIAKDEINQIRESGIGGLGHACELETSLYLYLKESGVRTSLIKDAGEQPEGSYFQTDMLQGSIASRVFDFDELTPSGVFGKPSLASAEKGQLFFKAITSRLNDFFKEIYHIRK